MDYPCWLTRRIACRPCARPPAPAQPLSTAAGQPPQPSGDAPKSIAEALDYRPALSPAQDALCALGAAALCTAAYALSAPATLQLRYAAGMALLYATLLLAARGWLLERKWQASGAC